MYTYRKNRCTVQTLILYGATLIINCAVVRTCFESEGINRVNAIVSSAQTYQNEKHFSSATCLMCRAVGGSTIKPNRHMVFVNHGKIQ